MSERAGSRSRQARCNHAIGVAAQLISIMPISDGDGNLMISKKANKGYVLLREASAKPYVIVAIVAIIVSMLMLVGCSSEEQLITEDKPQQVVLAVSNECADPNSNDQISVPGGDIDPTKYGSQAEYIEAAAPFAIAACNEFGFKWPSVLLAQMVWEGGFPLGNIGIQNKALFGIKAAGENQAEWPYWTNGYGLTHSDGGQARAYKKYVDSIFDYVDWLSRNNGDGTTADGTYYSSYLEGANAADNGQQALSNILNMGYCPNDYSAEAYSIAKNNNCEQYDKMVSSTGNNDLAQNLETSTDITVDGSIDWTQPDAKIWKFYREKGYSEAACAAVIGNMRQESQFDPHASNNGNYIGLCQWDSKYRWPRLVEYAHQNGKDEYDFDFQVEYSEYELVTHYMPGMDGFKEATDIDAATDQFLSIFEGAAGQELAKRQGYAHEAYEKFSGKTISSSESGENSSDLCDEETGEPLPTTDDELWYQQSTYPDAYADSTIARAGCGICSLAHVVTMLTGQSVTPPDVVHALQQKYSSWTSYFVSGVGTSHGILGPLAESEWGLKSEVIDRSVETFKTVCESGGMVILSSNGSDFVNSNGDNYHSGGHYIAVYKYSSGYFYVKDSSDAAIDGSCVKYSESQMQALLGHSGETISISK